MNVFFINYDGYCGSSGVHIHFLANALADRGHRCFVTVPTETNDNEHFGPCRYGFLSLTELTRLADAGSPLFRDAAIHAWTPREPVRILTQYMAQATGRPYVVHLEDNERHILEKAYNAPFEAVEAAARAGRLQPSPSFSHPVLHQEFLRGAAGVTCIIDTLARFVPEGVPWLEFWPACEEAFFRLPLAPNQGLRAQLGIGPEETVITYPGNFHFANAHVMQELYMALELLAARGRPVRLIRAGQEYAGISDEAKAAREKYVISLGMLPATRLPSLVSAADILVQPGMPGPFDDCRFPSKLPFFLASGRPLVTTPTNLGRHLKDGEHCLFLPDSSAQSIAAAVLRLMDDPSLCRRLGANGRAFAKASFSWDKSAARVEKFYAKVLGPA